MKKLEDYTLLFNPDGHALLIIDALPGEPDEPTEVVPENRTCC